MNYFKQVSGYFFVTIFAIPLVFSSLSPETASGSVVNAAAFNNAKPGEILVKFKGIDESQVVSFQNNEDAAQAINQFKNDDSIEVVQPNYIYNAASIPSDPLLLDQDYLEVINAFEGWDTQASAEDVVVAIIDSGVDLDHPDLINNVWNNPSETPNGKDDDGNGFIDDNNGWDFSSGVSDPRPKYSGNVSENAIGVQHGTVVAGILAASGNNQAGISGVAWNAQIMSLRVLNSVGIGDSETVTKAIQYAINAKVDVINMSLVGTDYDPLVVDLLSQAYEEGIIVVAAAGNSGVNLNASPTYPVCYNNFGDATVIGVGAIDTSFKRPGFSNYGSDCIDIVAPGVKVFSTRFVLPGFESQSQYEALFSGTSFSTPMVSGVIALMKQMRPSLTADQALSFLQNGATSISNIHAAGSGYDYALNVGKTLQSVTPESVSKNSDTYIPPAPKFLAYPISDFGATTVFKYQYPGPVLADFVVLEDELMSQGSRWTLQNPITLIFNSWSPVSKKVWQYNLLSNTQELLFEVGPSDPQNVGEVAIGNVDFDTQDEVIVVAGPDNLPLVSVYTLTGALKYRFQAYDNLISKGLDVELVDSNFDGVKEIVTVPQEQEAGHVKVFEYTGLQLAEWYTYARSFDGGATISVVDLYNDGSEKIIVGPGATGGPHVKIFTPFGDMEHEFFAGDVVDAGGVHVEYYDFDRSGTAEYVMSYKNSHTPVVRLYDIDGQFMEELGVLDGDYHKGIGIIQL